MLLRLKNIGKIYDSNDILTIGIRGVNLDFDYNEFVTIEGESGSGKSTLLNVIAANDSYEEGELYFNGAETSHYSETDWEKYREKNIAMIFQDFNIIENLTVLENVELALLRVEDKIERRKTAEDLIAKVGLTAQKNRKGSKLSGGEKQRTIIARALAKDSPVILADEPTGNLDVKASKEVAALLKAVSKDKLVIVVTHNPEFFVKYATRRVTIFDGSVKEDQVIRKPLPKTSADKEICAEINSSWARVALLPNDVPEDLVDYLYERAVTVWIYSDGTPEENYRAILKGAHGVISEDWAQTKADLATFTTPTLTRTPFVVGHGGMPVNYQPNSLRGFIDAYEAGADALENDLHMTKDGVVVLMHGTGVYGQEANGDFIDDIAAQTTGTGKIHELTWAQLQQYRIDDYKNLPTEPILDLDTYLREFADKPIKHYMELKRQRQTDMVAPVVELVKKYGMQDRMVFITYWDNVAAELRKQMPQCSVELLVDNGSVIVNDQGFEGLLEKLNPDNLAYSPNYRTFDTDQIAELAKRGILTYSWTYGTPGEFASAYAANRYSLTTDYALWAKELENEITFSKRSVTMGTSVDESVYFKGAVSTRSGQTRNNEIFSVRIIEGDIKLIRTANGKYYADRPGKAKAVVYYDSENRFDYSTDAGSGVQSLSYRLYSSEIVEIEVQGVTPALPGGGSSAGKSDPPASQGEAGEKTGGCGAFVERRTLLCFATCAIVLWTIGRKKEMRRK